MGKKINLLCVDNNSIRSYTTVFLLSFITKGIVFFIKEEFNKPDFLKILLLFVLYYFVFICLPKADNFSSQKSRDNSFIYF